jgi:hypothetical protein
MDKDPNYKYTIFDGQLWEEQGPYCKICKAHMGHNPDMTPCFINPHGYESYANNTCPDCGQEYEYEEGNMLALSEEQLQLLAKHRGVHHG